MQRSENQLFSIGLILLLCSYLLYFYIGINLDSTLAMKEYGNYLDHSHHVLPFAVIQISIGLIGVFIIFLIMNNLADSVLGSRKLSFYLVHSNFWVFHFFLSQELVY